MRFGRYTIGVFRVRDGWFFLPLKVMQADSAASPVTISTPGFPFHREVVEVRGR
jgi:hypothetical protein